MIRGQESIINKINSLTIDMFPRTLMLLGEYGSGKHSIVNYIGSRLGCDIEDISNKLTLEYIETINQRVSPMVYVIDSNELNVRNENVILKFLEEPLKNAFIVVLSENKYNTIPTILNRCQVWELASYEQSFLKSFIEDTTVDCTILMKVANTPGKVMKYQTYPIDDMMQLALKIFNNIGRANFANVLTLSRFIAFKNEKDKFDFSLFVDIMLLISKDRCVQDAPYCIPMYLLTSKLNNNKYIFNIDKKALFENYLIELKLLTNGGN